MKHFIAFLLLLSAPFAVSAQSASETPMTRAVMKVYDKMIENDPTDYETLLARAGELYNHDDYVKAQADLDQALRYAPESAKEVRFSAHQLRVGVGRPRSDWRGARPASRISAQPMILPTVLWIMHPTRRRAT